MLQSSFMSPYILFQLDVDNIDVSLFISKNIKFVGFRTTSQFIDVRFKQNWLKNT